MSLEVLKNIEKIGGFDVVDMVSLKETHPHMFREDASMKYEIFEKEIRPHNFIYLRRDVNSLAFTVQNGPVKEVGVNGCQVDTLIQAAKAILEGFDNIVPCPHNKKAMDCLDLALIHLQLRKEDREKRSVEGTMKS